MAQISVEELYRGESAGSKYGAGGIISKVTTEILMKGVPHDYDEQTWIEMLIVKYTLETAEKMRKEGDFISGMIDTKSPSCCMQMHNENL